MDMIMLSLFNSREREKEDWQSIFQQADTRFTNVQVWIPEGATLAIIEATLGPWFLLEDSTNTDKDSWGETNHS